MAQSTSPTPRYGRRLVPSLIDEQAERNPERVYALVPRSSAVADGLIKVNFQQLATIVDTVAFWLTKNVLQSKDGVLAYIGPIDLRYHIMTLAASKTGHQILLPSPRNTIEAQHRLFTLTSCSVLLHDANIKSQELLVGNAAVIRAVAVPALIDMLSFTRGQKYPYDKTFDEGRLDPFAILHTSGSTGIPKPIRCSLGWASTIDAKNAHPGVDGLAMQPEYFRRKTVLVALPFFHAGGIALGFLGPLFYDYTVMTVPSGVPISTPLIEDMLEAYKPDMVFMAPSLLGEFARGQNGLARLSKLEAVGYTGGPLAHDVGEEISKVTMLINSCGSTEILMAPTLQHYANEDWEYHFFDPGMKGIEFRDRGGGVYEQFIVRHESTDPYHAAWYTFPDLSELPMHDLYAKHPSRPHHWKNIGRSDDIIVFSNGEKINPVDMESHLQNSPLVKGALIVGQGHFHSAAIIELHQAAAREISESDIVEEMWYLVKHANDLVPAHGRIFSKDHIMIAPAEKPFLRAGKGTIQRRATVEFFGPEIEELFARTTEAALPQSGKDDQPAEVIDITQSVEQLTTTIQSLIEHTLGIKGLDTDVDLFVAYGVDSLAVVRIVKALRLAVTAGSSATSEMLAVTAAIDNHFVYRHSTCRKLSSALRELSSAHHGNGTGDSSAEEEEVESMRRLFAKYTADLLPRSPRAEAETHLRKPETVVLTGSSGSLGTYLLHELLTSPSFQVRKVYCLNRRLDAGRIQVERHAAKGLETSFDSRVVFLAIDIGQPHLGLNDEDYKTLIQETSLIIHNQWQVNFNLGLESFEPQVAGVRYLIDLAAAAPLQPPIIFTSSISVAAHWQAHHNSDEEVPETALEDWTAPEAQGYGESKFVSEQILERASQMNHASSVVLRIGQITGPVTTGDKGIWNKQEWFPSLIASSKFLKQLPDSLAGQNEIRWMPVDLVARTIIDISESCLKSASSGSCMARFYDILNPSACEWSDLVPEIQHCLEARGCPVKTVSLESWVLALQASAVDGEEASDLNPAIKLLEFFESLQSGSFGAHFHVGNAVPLSATLGSLKAVSREWMEIWFRQWG